MEIYLDSNATTPVCLPAQKAALAAMVDGFGNPSSIHGTGLKARAVLDQARASARRVLGATSGQLFFTSGATEGIQTAVLSALTELRRLRDTGVRTAQTLLYGATEHKAVPEALKHWNALLGLNLPLHAIPVGTDGRHDLAWLRANIGSAGLVCTMAANNETGVISDLDGIAQIVGASRALWLVDGVQSLGKLPLQLTERRIDYAPFSGHKFYAPKGIGMLYVREGAPFTPLLAGGGQEGALRGGTENMTGIAALGAVLQAYEDGGTFQTHEALADHRVRLAAALRDAFPGLVFNAPDALSLPTTLNFSVPGITSKVLLDLFDAARLSVSGGSACSAAKALPSYVLEAMGLPAWQSQSAVRLSFGALDTTEVIDEACRRLRACGESLRANCLAGEAAAPAQGAAPQLITRFMSGSTCSYLLADAASGECVVIDATPEVIEPITRWMQCRHLTPLVVLCTGRNETLEAAAQTLRSTWSLDGEDDEVDALGWPDGADHIALGEHVFTRLPDAGESSGYALYEGETPRYAFVGDVLERVGPTDLSWIPVLKSVAQAVGPDALMLSRQDAHGGFALSLRIACAEQPGLATLLALKLLPSRAVRAPTPAGASESLTPKVALALLQADPRAVVVDVRESYEHDMQVDGLLASRAEAVPLSSLVSALPRWLALPHQTPVLFYCRSGNRSAQAALALRRLGHAQAWSLAGGMALWTEPEVAQCA